MEYCIIATRWINVKFRALLEPFTSSDDLYPIDLVDFIC